MKLKHMLYSYVFRKYFQLVKKKQVHIEIKPRKENLKKDIRHVSNRVQMVHIYIDTCLMSIDLTRQGNTSTIAAIFQITDVLEWSRAGHKAKRLVLQCINGVSSNPVEGRTKICQLKDLILTLFGLIFKRIYIHCIKSNGIYQQENLMSNGSSRHDYAAQIK